MAIAAPLEARIKELESQVAALVAILDETHSALFDRCYGVPATTKDELRILDLSVVPLGLFGNKSDLKAAAAAHDARIRAEERDAMRRSRPTTVCLCGSTRFFETFQEASLQETVAGKIVLSIGCNLRSDHQLWADPAERDSIKARLDELHLRKIDMADEVLVLNVGGYIGDSTRREVAYAESIGRPIRYWEAIRARGNTGSEP